MRKLRYHESRLLRKTNFLKYPDVNYYEHKIISMYQIEDRDQLIVYRRIIGMIKQIAYSLACLANEDAKGEIQSSSKLDSCRNTLLNKLYSAGLIPEKKLKHAVNLKLADFCERRITTLLKRQNFTNSIVEAVKLVKQGHIKIGNKNIINCDVLVSRGMENFIGWVDGSKHKKCIDEFNDCLDEYEG